MKKTLFFAAITMMFAACTNETAVAPQLATEETNTGVVAFDTYTSSATRAGEQGVMTTGTLQTTGFGVFAQYSSAAAADGAYSKTTNPVANFMWNQYVNYSSSAWTYDPLKYWPNETHDDNQGGTDGDATSSYQDKLSFFAYAPFVAEVASTYTGKVTGPTYSADPVKTDSKISAGGGGIEAFIANDATGDDPWVRYTVATTPENSVDLLWGVAPSGGLSYQDVTRTTVSISQGMPLVDLTKPGKDEKIKFLFQHALARLGLTVVAAVDQIAPGGSLDAATKIAVKSVNITETTSPKVLKTSGALNLKNTTAFQSLWEETSGDISFTVSGTTLNPAIKYVTDAATTYGDASITGVTTTEKKVIAQTGSPAHDNYFMVIPGHANTQLQVVIDYVVITADAKLDGGYSEVENVITKKVTIPTLTNNKAYNLKLILGMTSVKLDAEVADWEVDGSTNVYLPKNEE